MKKHVNKVLSTQKFAAYMCVKAGTVRKCYCYQGHYAGYVPVKLESGRLAWPLPKHISAIGEVQYDN